MKTTDCVPDDLMNRLYDGDMPPEERTKLKEHIEGCPACKEQWASLVAGAQFLAQAFKPREPDTSNCYDDETLAAYVDAALTPAKMAEVEGHLAICPICEEEVLTTRYLLGRWQDSEAQPETEAVAGGVLEVLSRVPDAAERLGAWLREEGRRVIAFLDDIALPCFEPRQLALQRLAAETGEGFGRQRLGEPDSPFDVELVQFGREARVIVTVKPEAAEFSSCLVEVRFLEEDQPRLTRSILVKDGQGQCVLTPGEVGGLRPESRPFRLTVQAIVTLERLRELEADASVAILSDLLEHDDPFVRRLSAEMLGETGSPHALDALRKAKSDSDPSVQRAAAAAEQKLSRGQKHGGTGNAQR